MDLPLINPEYKSSFTYPPLIKLRVTITKTSDAEAVDSFCYLEVLGIDHKLKMMVEIASPQKLKGRDSQISGKEQDSTFFINAISSLSTFPNCTDHSNIFKISLIATKKLEHWIHFLNIIITLLVDYVYCFK